MLPFAYVAVVIGIAVARALNGHPSLSALALTPDRLAEGKVWLMFSSAAIVNGPVLSQIVALTVTVFLAVRRFGAAFTLAVMLIAHIGATLLAYAGLALFTGDADGAHNRSLDYGVSAVWLGLVGALTIAAFRRRDQTLVALGAALAVASVTLFPLLAATEHGLAFALGAVAVALRERRSGAYQSVRSAASTASARAESA